MVRAGASVVVATASVVLATGSRVSAAGTFAVVVAFGAVVVVVVVVVVVSEASGAANAVAVAVVRPAAVGSTSAAASSRKTLPRAPGADAFPRDAFPDSSVLFASDRDTPSAVWPQCCDLGPEDPDLDRSPRPVWVSFDRATPTPVLFLHAGNGRQGVTRCDGWCNCYFCGVRTPWSRRWSAPDTAMPPHAA
ncbi:hypothetical protein BTZ20_5702 [Rhodococcus sp. MTM3W5.2]|nr:hypothetical protein BTZ20_5702 [Rhodococcus sp. MTM3W5.2]